MTPLNVDRLLRSPRKGPGGFTLVEILVTMFIFGIIATTLFGSFRSLFGQTGSVEGRMQIYAMAQYCLNRMTTDLRMLHVVPADRYRPPGVTGTADPFRFVGDVIPVGAASFSRLRFASLAHLPMENTSLQGVAEVVYYVSSDAQQRFLLRRADRVHPAVPFRENGRDPVLAEGIRSLSLRYLDAKGTAHETWDSDSGAYDYASPTAVEIALALDEAAGPVWFKTRVNLPVSRQKPAAPAASPP